MLSRNIDKAKEAYKRKDVEAMKAAHNGHVHSEPHKQNQGQYIGSAVYGGLDGIITTFAVVAGVAGAQLSTGVLLILGFANLIADGISMAIGDFLSTRAEQEYNTAEKKREAWEVEVYPEGEKLELIELYMAKGYEKEDAKKMVDIVAKNKEGWIDIMMKEELGIMEDNDSPLKNALVTFGSFALFGFVPLLAFTVAQLFSVLNDYTFLIATIMTGLTLFLLGALKVHITDQKWYKSGLEMLIVGGVAAASAYFVGMVLRGMA